MSEIAQRQPKPIEVVRNQLEQMDAEIAKALPAHIPVERFKRVVMTAIQNNPDLVTADRRSLWNAAMRAAQDGLLPDGRDGAIVTYKGEAQWMVMIGGIRKKVRNSGEIATWDVQAVYSGDEFDYALGDNPYIHHKPALSDRGKLIAVYSIATLKSGEKSRDVMSVEDVEKIRAISRSKGGPWSNPTFYPEMAKKTVARRHSKVLPMSSDLDDLIRRDDHLYDLEGSSDKEAKGPRGSLSERLTAIAGGAGASAPALSAPAVPERIDADTGEIIEAKAEPAKTEEAAPSADPDDDFPGDRPMPKAAEKAGDEGDEDRDQTPEDVAYDKGWKAQKAGMSRKAVPTDYRTEERGAEARAWLRGFDEAAQQ